MKTPTTRKKGLTKKSAPSKYEAKISELLSMFNSEVIGSLNKDFNFTSPIYLQDLTARIDFELMNLPDTFRAAFKTKLFFGLTCTCFQPPYPGPDQRLIDAGFNEQDAIAYAKQNKDGFTSFMAWLKTGAGIKFANRKKTEYTAHEKVFAHCFVEMVFPDFTLDVYLNKKGGAMNFWEEMNKLHSTKSFRKFYVLSNTPKSRGENYSKLKAKKLIEGAIQYIENVNPWRIKTEAVLNIAHRELEWIANHKKE